MLFYQRDENLILLQLFPRLLILLISVSHQKSKLLYDIMTFFQAIFDKYSLTPFDISLILSSFDL